MKILNKERDLDSMKTKNDGLEAQIHDAQDRYKKELEELQVKRRSFTCTLINE